MGLRCWVSEGASNARGRGIGGGGGGWSSSCCMRLSPDPYFGVALGSFFQVQVALGNHNQQKLITLGVAF